MTNLDGLARSWAIPATVFWRSPQSCTDIRVVWGITQEAGAPQRGAASLRRNLMQEILEMMASQERAYSDLRDLDEEQVGRECSPGSPPRPASSARERKQQLPA